MARPLRLEFPGACFHAINRGNYRRNIFAGEGAAEAFERALGEAAGRFSWRIHAYVVMRNHYHLGLELSEPNLGEGMKWLQGTWVRRSNLYRGLTGRPFQDRFKAILVEPGHSFAQVCHYVHLNPVRAGVVPVDRLAEYPLSSLPRFDKRSRPEWLDPSTVLLGAGGLNDSVAGWRRYRSYLEFLATDNQAKKELVAAKMSRSWCLGSSEFRKEMRDEVRKRESRLQNERFAGLDRDEVLAEREAAWEELLKRAARLARIDLDALPEPKMAPEKSLLAAVLKQTTSASNGWLASRLQMGKPATASQAARRVWLDPQQQAGLNRLVRRLNQERS